MGTESTESVRIESAQGKSEFRGVDVGAEVYDHEANELLRIVEMSRIHIDQRPGHGNYVFAEVERSERHPAHLSDSEFEALPRVRVVRGRPESF